MEIYVAFLEYSITVAQRDSTSHRLRIPIIYQAFDAMDVIWRHSVKAEEYAETFFSFYTSREHLEYQKQLCIGMEEKSLRFLNFGRRRWLRLALAPVVRRWRPFSE